MTVNGWLQIGLFALLVLLLTKPVGLWLFRVFESRARPLPRLLGPVERFLFASAASTRMRSRPGRSTRSRVLVFSAVGVLVTYALLRLQRLLP